MKDPNPKSEHLQSTVIHKSSSTPWGVKKSANKWPKIIAVDFDGTLCENKWPDIGEPNQEVIEYILTEQSKGAKLILWTNRVTKRLANAIEWCAGLDIYFDAVNANLDFVIKFFGTESRKIFANEFIDDYACTKFKLPYIKGQNEKSERIIGVDLASGPDFTSGCIDSEGNGGMIIK